MKCRVSQEAVLYYIIKMPVFEILYKGLQIWNQGL